MTTWIGLLRGVNVGGRNRMPMAELRALVADVGGGSPRTYIQSGNLIFEAEPTELAALVAQIEAGIVAHFGFASTLALRTREELVAAAQANPFRDVATEPKWVSIGFLDLEPTPKAVAGLDPNRSPGDAFLVHGREIHLYFSNGSARSKLTNTWFDRALGVRSTWRNWNTLQKLIELSA